MASVRPAGKPAPEGTFRRIIGDKVKEKDGSEAKKTTGQDSAITRRGQGYWTLSTKKKKSRDDHDDDDDDEEDNDGSKKEEYEEVVGPKVNLTWEMRISEKGVDLTIKTKGFRRSA